MPRIVITAECDRAIRRAATWPFDGSEAKVLADGRISIPLSQETLNNLRKYQFEGESLSDTILRIVSGRPQ